MMRKYSIGDSNKIFRAVLVFVLMIIIMQVFGDILKKMIHGGFLYGTLQVIRWTIPVMALVYIGDLVLVRNDAASSGMQDTPPLVVESEVKIAPTGTTVDSREKFRLTAFLYIVGGVLSLPLLLFGIFIFTGHTNSFFGELGVILLGIGVTTLPLVLIISGLVLFVMSLRKSPKPKAVRFWKKAPLLNALFCAIGILLG